MVEKKKFSPRFFSIISWGLTAVIVLSLLGFTIWRIFPVNTSPELVPTRSTGSGGPAVMPEARTWEDDTAAIVRVVSLDTSVETSVRYDVVEYSVKRGDTVSSIAENYGLDSTSLMWANEKLMQDGPTSLSVGQVLLIPPVDGVLYQWEEEDSLEAVAERFDVTADDILLWPGNNIDLSDPVIETEAYVMVPGGKADAIVWYPTVLSGMSTGSTTACGTDGPVGVGWLAYPSPYHDVGGYFFNPPTHNGLDFTAPEGTVISAADSGVVVRSNYVDEWGSGYGFYVMIDHLNGMTTLYAHLSQVNVIYCQPVYAGEIIGLSGNTGNSIGAHLHFEVMVWGSFVYPFDYLPSP